MLASTLLLSRRLHPRVLMVASFASKSSSSSSSSSDASEVPSAAAFAIKARALAQPVSSKKKKNAVLASIVMQKTEESLQKFAEQEAKEAAEKLAAARLAKGEEDDEEGEGIDGEEEQDDEEEEEEVEEDELVAGPVVGQTIEESAAEILAMDEESINKALDSLVPKPSSGRLNKIASGRAAVGGVVKRDHVRVIDGKGRQLAYVALADAHALALKANTTLRLFSPNPVTYILEPKAHKVARNNEITHRQLIVQTASGESLGELPIELARAKAMAAGLDLVLVSDTPPTARICEYSKYLFQLRKAKKVQQPVTRIKQVRFGAFSEEHDIDTKFKQVVGFLQSGKQVRVLIHFKRMRDFDQDGALNTLEYLKAQLAPHGSAEATPSVTPGKGASLTFTPKKKHK